MAPGDACSIGRSGRFGRKGVAINFVRSEDIKILRDIEQYYATQIDEMPMNGMCGCWVPFRPRIVCRAYSVVCRAYSTVRPNRASWLVARSFAQWRTSSKSDHGAPRASRTCTFHTSPRSDLRRLGRPASRVPPSQRRLW